jgi:hypothetical protein
LAAARPQKKAASGTRCQRTHLLKHFYNTREPRCQYEFNNL